MSNGFLKDFKSLFIVPEDESVKAEPKASATKPSADGKMPANQPKEVISDTPSPGKINDKFLNVLFSAIEKNNQEGFDYLEFRNSLQSLKEMNMDEATRVMLQVHQKGVGVCGVFSYEVAETKVAQVMDFARRHQHPLQCTMERE